MPARAAVGSVGGTVGAAVALKPGDRVLCAGIGSGLNTSLTEIAW